MLVRSLGLVLLLVTLLVAVSGLGCSADTTWPQAFKLYAGQTAKFTFEVPKPESIGVNVTWQGVGLFVALVDPSGKTVNTPAQQASPVTLTHAATAADVQKGTQWTVVIGTPPAKAPSQQPVAQGEVTVKVQQALIMPGQRITIPDPIKDRIDQGLPVLTSISPDAVGPNDVVTVKARNVPSDKTAVDAYVAIGGNAPALVPIIDATADRGIVSYQVSIPDASARGIIRSQVYVEVKASSAQTNNLPFSYNPCPPPVITNHSPREGISGDNINLFVKYFKQSDELYFVVPGKSDVLITNKILVNTSQLIVSQIAVYPAGTQNATAYLRSNCGGAWITGPKYSFPLYWPAK